MTQVSNGLFYIPPVASLKDLMSILCKTVVPNNLKQFGIMLNFDKTFLDYIEVNNQDLYQSLIDVLDLWLKGVNPPPCWSVLIKALQSLGEEVVVWRCPQLRSSRVHMCDCT